MQTTGATLESSEPHSHESPEPTLDLETWQSTFSSRCFLCDMQSDEPKVFSGRLKFWNVLGFNGLSLSFNSARIERTQRYARADGIEHYCAAIGLAGRATLVQNDQGVPLGVGDIVLLDTAQPLTIVTSDNIPGEWLGVHLPRRTLVAHFGFEPRPGARAAAVTLAGRLLSQLLLEVSQDGNESSAQSDHYMQLTVYDMLGALFAGANPSPVSAHTHKLFERVCDIIRNSFSDPDFGPAEVAAEAGVSLRYLQKLFTSHGHTCTHFIQSLRLDHALRLIHRRNRMSTRQPLSQIAYLCGFRDYNYFARAFRHRFGYSPGATGGELGVDTGVSTPDVRFSMKNKSL